MLGVVLGAYLVWARPYQLRWGATDEEVLQPLPGDELDPSPTFLATRAITIQGTPEAIWPWLMQMGYTRAGFYGYDLFENVGSPRGLQSAERIIPQYQNFQVGDAVPISPVAQVVFHTIQPHEYIVWSGEDSPGGFTWALQPLDETRTRLVSRIRWSHHWSEPGLLSLDLFTEFTDHLAVRKVLEGVKGRVEGNSQPPSDATIELFLYVGSVLAFAWAAISVLRLPLTWGSWLVGLAGGAAWLMTWYAPVSIWLGAALSFVVVWAVRVEFRDLARLKNIAARRAGPRGDRSK
jgi:hypothetical protein